ncbi:Enterobactin synthase component F [Paracoccus haematequi]|uniref:Enterobactin synthase component F n=1 Tax=Paracoccus haematequi TaxID=2491866 RepID=A0A447IMD3_9RHOB|nr:non-ribosomal peptide synthetase [Paracoccus haematequi]VDS08678.1 Enterobactin synthase component F [Paracoccus haematequi]
MRPLTEAQEGLWYAQALDQTNPILNTGQYLDLRGPVDLEALHQALTRTLRETEALRLRFRQGPHGPEQWLDPAPILPALVRPADEAQAHAAMRADSGRAIDLAAEPAAAFTIFALGPDRVLVYERIHHLAIDGYGMVLVTNRIGEHYSAIVTGGPAPLPFPPLDRAHDEDAAYRASDRRAQDAAWWQARLAGLPEVTGPATGTAVSAHHFLRESRWLDAGLLARLADFSDTHRLGWPDALTGLTGAYLARWTGGSAVIGVPFMARMGRKIARLPCMAMNVLPQQVTPDEEAPLADWLSGLARDMAQARRHGLYRSEYLRRDLGLIGGSRRLYGPLVNVQPFDRAPRFAGLQVGLHILGAGAVDDLTLTFRGDPQSGLLFEVDANPTLYSPQDVAGHSARLPEFLAAALDAATLAPVPTASRAEIAAAAAVNATDRPIPDTTLAALIQAQIAATPDAPAVTFGDSTISFADLDRRSAALAAHLAGMGAGPGRIVAVALERSLNLPVVLLAILRAGAAYLPLDPDHPPDRIARILSMARPVAVITSLDLKALFPADAPLLTDWPDHGTAPARPAPDDMAYVIFTSGSTGEPKGVVIDHRAIVNRLLWMRDHYGIDASDRILQKTPATFDVSVWEFFLPMIAGAELVMAPPGAHRDPSAIAALIRRHAITTLHFVPSMLSAFLAAPASQGLALRRVFCSGEELTADQRSRFHARIRAELHNLYGPTEAAVDVSFWPAGPEDASNPLPIGWPVWNTALHVLDDRMRPVPPGLAGHLYLGGAQLARGYLGRDDLTAQRFIAAPDGTRLYATGDLARRRHDGAVVYLGRSDHQVKIRGLRIELGEIEAAVMASGLARECVVLAREDRAGEKRLVGYVVPSGGDPAGLSAHLAASLPAYMVPAAWVMLDALPVTSNGKLDRKALPAPEFSAAGRAAQTETEHLLSRLYAEVLHLPDLPGAQADFFALGGDSLSAVRLCLRIEEETGRDPGLGTIFEHPVLELLAAAFEKAHQDDGLSPLILLADGDPAASPLFLIHPAGGIAWGYRHLARLIAPARRVWGVQHPALDLTVPLPDSLQALARDYAARIAAVAPDGPVHLAGWSVGGILAQSVAIELAAHGRQAGLVAALDSYPADVWRNEPEPDPVAALRALLAIAGHDPDAHRDLDTRQKVVAFLRAGDTALGALPEAVLDGVVRTVTDTNRLVRGHHHRHWPGRLTHIRAGLDHRDRDLRAGMWRAYATHVEELSVPFLHPAMTSAAASALIAPMLAARMDQADAAAKGSASGRDPAIVSM